MAIQTNVVTVRPKRDAAVSLPAVPAAIRGAGFTPGDMTVRAVGRVERAGDHMVFRIRGWPGTYALEGEFHDTGIEQDITVVVNYSGPEVRFRPGARNRGAEYAPD